LSKKQKKFKIRYVVLIILLVILVAAALVIRSQWDLIQAAKIGLTTDPETIQAQQEEKDREVEESLGIEGMITEEMVAAAQAEFEAQMGVEPSAEQGPVNVADESGAIGGSVAPGQTIPSGGSESGGTGSSGGSGGSSGQTTGGTAASAGNSSADIVAKYTAKLYGVRGAVQGRIDALVASAKSEYLALPEEQRTSAARNSILSAKLGQAEAIESECDGMVEGVLSEMQAELSAGGYDTSPVKQLRSHYQEMKASQKAAYIAQIRGG